MTASIASGVVHGADPAQRSQSAARPRSQEWHALYERQLAGRRAGGVPEDLRDAGARPSAAGRDAGDTRDEPPDGSRVIVVAAGGHLELQVISRGSSATTPGVVVDADEVSGPGSPSMVPSQIPNSPAGSTLQTDAHPEMSVDRGMPRHSAATATRQSPSDHSVPATPTASEGALAQTLSGSEAMVPPRVFSAQPAGALDSQQSRHRLAAAQAPSGALAASRAALQASVGAPGRGAGAMQQDEGEAMDSRESERDAVPTHDTSARHYGTFPLIVSGELLELEFVALRSARAQRQSAAVGSIFLSMQPPGMRRVELTVQRLGDGITVRVGGQAAGCEAATDLDVPALLQRLGWGAYPVKSSDGVIR